MQNSKELITGTDSLPAKGGEKTDADVTVNGNSHQQGSVIQEILATPFIKEMVRESLNSARASSSSSFVKNLMWQDMDFFFSLIASLPLIVNSLVTALGELGGQLDEKIEPGLLKEYMAGVLGEIDTAGFSQALDTYGNILTKLMERDDVREVVMSSIRDTLAASLGRGINTSLKAVNRAQDDDPAFIGGTLDSVTQGIDNKEAGRALMGVINPVLDRISFTKIIWHFITGRIKYKLQRKKYKTA